MSNHPSPPYYGVETASSHKGGGCFSFLLSPIYLIVLALAVFLMASGETSHPWELSADGAEPSANHISPIFTPEVRYWENSIFRWASQWDLDPNLLATVMQIESCGDPEALSRAGAIGLFQVMPYHFSSGDFPTDPDTNAARGMAYLHRAMGTYGTVRLALASYNGGISTASLSENLWPEETIGYVYWGEKIYQDAVNGAADSPRLQEWLASGGASLCAQANQRLNRYP